MSFKEIQKEKTAQIERILKAYLPRVQGYQEVIMDAMSYSMLAGGIGMDHLNGSHKRLDHTVRSAKQPVCLLHQHWAQTLSP